MLKRTLFGTCAIFAGMLAVSPCMAEEPQAARGTAAKPTDTNVDEVVVRAERREQSLQDVPIAISVFTDAQRDITGITTLGDMTNFAPGLTYQANNDHVFVRGVGRQTANLAAPAGVATFIDGFYNPDPILVVLPPLFIDSVEVLRGPQGTLGGRNGIAGALMLTAKRPTDTFKGELRTGFGNYGYSDLEGEVSGPIMKGLDFRLAGYNTRQSQGYFTNVAGGASEGGVINESHFEGALTAKFGDHADGYLRASTSKWNNGAGGPGSRNSNFTEPYSTFLNDQSSSSTFNAAAGYNPAVILPGSLVQRNPSITSNPGSTDYRNFSGYDTAKVTLHDAYNVNGTFNYKFPAFDVKYIGGYSQYTYTTRSDSGGQETDVLSYVVPQTQNIGFGTNPTCAPSANPFTTCLTVRPQQTINFAQTDKWYSHELTATSTKDGPLQWIAGVYYYDERYSNPVRVVSPSQTQIATPCYIVALEGPGAGPSANCAAAIGLGAAPANPANTTVDVNYDMRSRSEAAYAQLDWQVTSQVKLTGGVRYTSDHVSGTESARAVFFGGAGLVGAGAALYATPQALGAATPAVDVTPVLCASDNASTNHQGQKTACIINAAGYATRGLGDDSDAWTGTAGVEWKPDHDTLVYGRYSRGYKSLGFNAGFDLLGQPSSEVAPEFMNDYEIGFKKTWNRKVSVNATLFYEDYHDAQVPLSVLTSAGAQTFLTSIPKSRSAGLEVEASWKATTNLQLAMSYAYNETAVLSACQLTPVPVNCYLDGANPGAGPQNIKGHALPNAPRNKLSVNGNYRFTFDPGDLVLSASYLWRDKQYGAVFDNPWWVSPSSSDVDLRATWQGAGDRYEIVVFAKNVFDTKQYDSGPGANLAGNAATPAVYTQYVSRYLSPPRTYGMELHYKF